MEGASADAEEAGEPIGAGEAEGAAAAAASPAVPPIRRRAENGVEKKPE